MFGFGNNIDVDTIQSELQNNTALLVDVRDDDEWEAKHASDAVHLSLDLILQGEVPTKDTSKKLYLYCVSGGRASVAAAHLEAVGYTVENIGGLSGWKASGGSTTSGY